MNGLLTAMTRRVQPTLLIKIARSNKLLLRTIRMRNGRIVQTESRDYIVVNDTLKT